MARDCRSSLGSRYCWYHLESPRSPPDVPSDTITIRFLVGVIGELSCARADIPKVKRDAVAMAEIAILFENVMAEWFFLYRYKNTQKGRIFPAYTLLQSPPVRNTPQKVGYLQWIFPELSRWTEKDSCTI